MARVRPPAPRSPGEEAFALHCRVENLTPEREFVFCERKWRFDFAWPERKLAVEVEGGVFSGRSRHTTGSGYEGDLRKYNRAARRGWTVLRFTTAMVLSGEAIQEVLETLAGD